MPKCNKKSIERSTNDGKLRTCICAIASPTHMEKAAFLSGSDNIILSIIMKYHQVSNLNDLLNFKIGERDETKADEYNFH